MKKSPEYFEKKLHIPRDAEGELNSKALEEVRGLEKRLAVLPAFVALGPVGSTVGGYSLESSDIDVNILYDAAPENNDKILWGFIGIIKALQEEREREGKKDLGILLKNIDPEAAWKPFRGSSGLVTFPLISALAEMSKIAIGNKINDYREIYRKELHKLSAEQRKSILEQTAMFLARQETMSIPKRQQRIMPQKSEEEIFGLRHRLWQKRVESLWGR